MSEQAPRLAKSSSIQNARLIVLEIPYDPDPLERNTHLRAFLSLHA